MTDLHLTPNQTISEAELEFEAASQELNQLLLQLTLDKQETQAGTISPSRDERPDAKSKPSTASLNDFQKAAIAYQEASDALQLAMEQLDEARNSQSDAKTKLETKTLDYALAIQTVNDLADQPMVTESERQAANQHLAHAKSTYNTAKSTHHYQVALSQIAYYTVVQTQATYDTAQLAFDLAKTNDLDANLSGLKHDDKQSETSANNIDFLMNFLSHHPKQGETSHLGSDPEPPQLFDPNLPFERRPAIERPLAVKHLVQTGETHSGHINWTFDDSTPHKTEHTTHDKNRI